MKLEDLQKQIEEDSKIDEAALDMESLRIPLIHAKYYRFYMDEFKVFKSMDMAHNDLYLQRTHFYLGKSPDEVYGAEPLDHRVIKSDLDVYLKADQKLSVSKAKLDIQKAKVEMIEAFIYTLNNRSFMIKNAIEFRRFQVGG